MTELPLEALPFINIQYQCYRKRIQVVWIEVRVVYPIRCLLMYTSGPQRVEILLLQIIAHVDILLKYTIIGTHQQGRKDPHHKYLDL